jgi:hypothetical protein
LPFTITKIGALDTDRKVVINGIVNSKNLASKVTIMIEKSNCGDCVDKLLIIEIFSICLEILRFDLKNFTEDNNAFIVNV